MTFTNNGYEKAFEGWLKDAGLKFTAAGQSRRSEALGKCKSFDFVIYRRAAAAVMAEVKGRKFKGASLAGLKGLQCWVTLEDVKGLLKWRQIFSDMFGQEKGQEPCEAVFVFAYELESVDVDADGLEVYEFEGKAYVFFVVRLDDYRANMTGRSPKWRTVMLPAAKFRETAVPAEKFFGNDVSRRADGR